ncbi:MAG: hypothetical protein V1865_02995 [bacterium]
MLGQTEQIFNQILKANSILVIANNDSGDSLAAGLGLFLFLQKQEKRIDLVVNNLEQQKKFNFLPEWDKIKKDITASDKFVISLDLTKVGAEQVKYKMEKDRLDFIIKPKEGKFKPEDVSFNNGPDYDLIIIIGYADLDSLGALHEKNTDFFYKTPVINIDHDPANESFGQINAIDLNATANSEIIFNILNEHDRTLITGEIATCLLTGMITRTKSFKTSNVTPRALTIASELITMGADRTNIVDRLYRSRKLGVLNLWGKVLTGLSSSLGNKLVWAKLRQADFIETKTNQEDLIDVIDELIVNIPEARLIALIFQKENNQTSAILYSPKNINCLEVAKELNPVGTKALVRVNLPENLEQSAEKIISSLEGKIKQLPL